MKHQGAVATLADEVAELSRSMKETSKEFQDSAIPLRGRASELVPPFPTEPERRLRPLNKEET